MQAEAESQMAWETAIAAVNCWSAQLRAAAALLLASAQQALLFEELGSAERVPQRGLGVH